MDCMKIFFSGISLRHGQLWTITEQRADVNHYIFISFQRSLKASNEVKPLNPAEHLVGFELVTVLLVHKALNYKSTLPKFGRISEGNSQSNEK